MLVKILSHELTNSRTHELCLLTLLNLLNLLTNPTNAINLLNLLNLLYLYIWPNAYQGSPPHCVPSFPLPFVGLLAAAL